MATITWTPTVRFNGRAYQASHAQVKSVEGKQCLTIWPAAHNFVAFVLGKTQAELKQELGGTRRVTIAGTSAFLELLKARNDAQSSSLQQAPAEISEFFGGDAAVPILEKEVEETRP